MKIDVGKKYQARDGVLVEVLKVDAPGNYPVVGITVGTCGDTYCYTYTLDGSFYTDRASDRDLVSPALIEVVRYSIASEDGERIYDSYRTKEAADRALQGYIGPFKVIKLVGTIS